MTNEEAREILHQIRKQKCVTECDYSCKLYESETFCLEEKALDMAIKALDSWDKYSSELWESAYDRGFKDGVSEGIKAME